MPIKHRKTKQPHSQADQLRKELTQEWRKPDDNASEPVIIEENVEKRNQPIHLYVIWSRWAALSQQERSEIIMDAYEEAKQDKGELERVTVAMGLTEQEAARMGIEY